MSDISVKIGTYRELGRFSDPLLRRVFLEEQGVPEDEVFDGLSEQCLYAVVFDRGTPVSTVRLLETDDGVWRIGLVATKKAQRGLHFGEKAMSAAMEYIAAHDGREIVLDAQSTAAGFYEKLGFQPFGEPVVFESGFILIPMKHVFSKSP